MHGLDEKNEAPTFWERLSHQYDWGYTCERYGLDDPRFQAAAAETHQDWEDSGEKIDPVALLLGDMAGVAVGMTAKAWDVASGFAGLASDLFGGAMTAPAASPSTGETHGKSTSATPAGAAPHTGSKGSAHAGSKGGGAANLQMWAD